MYLISGNIPLFDAKGILNFQFPTLSYFNTMDKTVFFIGIHRNHFSKFLKSVLIRQVALDNSLPLLIHIYYIHFMALHYN